MLRSDVNRLLPLKRFGLAEVKCNNCAQVCISTVKSRSIWFVIFMMTLILLMLTGKQLAQIAGYSSDVSFIVLIVVYVLVNWLFSYIWPRVISIELKDRTE
jgi:uncharacterized membrane protein